MFGSKSLGALPIGAAVTSGDPSSQSSIAYDARLTGFVNQSSETRDVRLVGVGPPALHVPDVASTFYVDAVNGNDTTGTGSFATPWASLNKAYTYLRNTHTWVADKDIRVYIRAGTYQAPTGNENTLSIGFDLTTARKPTATQWVIWERYPGDARPVIREPAGTSSTTHKNAIKFTTLSNDLANYQQFVGLEVYGGDTRTNNTGDTIGFYLSNNTAFVEIVDCVVHGFQAMDTTGSITSKAQGIYIDPNATSNKVTRCYIYDIGTATGTINTQEHGLYCSGNNNSVWNNAVKNIVNGFAIQFYDGAGGGRAIQGIYCCHNTIVGPIEKSCIVVPGHGSNIVVKNNIFKGATEYGLEFYPATFTGANNAISHIVYHSNTIANRSHATPAGWSISNEQTADPLFVSSTDLHLQLGSPALAFSDPQHNPGVTLDGKARDSTPSAGAYETNQSTHSVDARVTGSAESSHTQDVRATGHIASTHAQDARIVGRADSSTDRDARVRGQFDSNAAQDARVTGRDDSTRAQDARIVGTADSTVNRDVRVTGFDYHATVRDVQVIGQDASATDRSVRVTGQGLADLTTDVRARGAIISSAEQAARVSGSLLVEASYGVRVTGMALSVAVRRAVPIAAATLVKPGTMTGLTAQAGQASVVRNPVYTQIEPSVSTSRLRG